MRDLLLIVILAGLLPAILMRPWIGILGWFWAGLMTPQWLAWSHMRGFQLAMVIGIVTIAAMLISRDRRPIPMTREMLTLALFVGYVTMTSAFAVSPSGAWEFWPQLMKILLVTFITPMLIFGQARIVWLLLVITGSLAFFGFKGGVFAILTGGNHMVLGPPNSYLSGNTYIGLAMVMILPMILATARMFHHGWVDFGLPLIQRLSRPISWGVYGIFWLTGIAILATYSRGAFVGVLAIAPFLFWRMRMKAVLVTLAFVAVTVVGVTAPERLVERWQTIENYEEDTSAMQRIQAWGVSWNMATERPVTGMGFGFQDLGYPWWISYANFEGPWRHMLSPHSVYFGVLAQHGFGGLAVFLALMGFTFFTLNRIRRTAERKTGQLWLAEYAWALQVGLIGYAVAGAFLDVAYFSLFYAFIALAVIMRRELEEAPGPSSQEQALRAIPSSAAPATPRFPDFIATSAGEGKPGHSARR